MSTVAGSVAEIQQELDYLVRARYPFIMVQTFEESRVENVVMGIAKSRAKKLFVWNCNKGLEQLFDDKSKEGISTAGIEQPQVILKYIDDYQGDAIFILKDFSVFVGKIPKVDRMIKDLVDSLRTTRKTVIVTSTYVQVTADLDKYITVVDFPMPDRVTMGASIDEILSEMRNHPSVKVNVSPGDRELLIEASMGLTLSESNNVLSKAAVRTGRIDSTAIQLVTNEKRQIVRKSGILEFYPAEDSLSDIGGLDNLKLYVQEREGWWTSSVKEFGLAYLKGMVLTGIPGCGKSLTAKVIASSWGLPLLRLDMGKVFDKYVGGSEENIRKALSVSEAVAPCVLWLDEVEKSMSTGGGGDNGTSLRVFGQFLTWMQEKKDPVYVVCTANDLSSLPPEFLRKGRFDEIWFVDLPVKDEIKEILAIHLRKKNRTLSDAEMQSISQDFVGYTGAEVEAALENALWKIFKSKSVLTKDVLVQSIKETKPLSEVMKSQLTSLREMAKGRFRYASSKTEKLVKEEANKEYNVEV